jgi:hypothetical protein
MGRADNRQEKYDKKKAAAEVAAAKDKAAKEALQEKMAVKGGAGKLSKEELKLAKRMGEGEGQKK